MSPKNSRQPKTPKKRSPATRKKSVSSRKKQANLKYRYDMKSVMALVFSILSFIISFAILIYVVLDDNSESQTYNTVEEDVVIHEKVVDNVANKKESLSFEEKSRNFFEENYNFLFEEKENKEHDKIFVPIKKVKKEIPQEHREEKKVTQQKTHTKEKKRLPTYEESEEEDLTARSKEIPVFTTIEEEVEKRTYPIKDKLAIIIDDVSFAKHLEFMKLGMNINLSFLPPTQNHPSSAKIARNISKYLIHLPCQSKSSAFREESATLHIDDDFYTIDARIRELKVMYPNAKVINNHTGSLFTANEQAMDYLMRSLKKHGFYFIDSRTTSKSVARKYADKYDVPMLSRNVFLDNKRDVEAIKKQLIKSVQLAHKYHQAIAIGHPYTVTLQAIKELKPYLESEVDLVLVHDLKFY